MDQDKLLKNLRISDKIPRNIDFGSVAQSVEQWPFKPCVAGSIPARPTINHSLRSGSWHATNLKHCDWSVRSHKHN